MKSGPRAGLSLNPQITPRPVVAQPLNFTDSWIAYPHSRGFLTDGAGTRVLLGQKRGDRLQIVSQNLEGSGPRVLFQCPVTDGYRGHLWWDAQEAGSQGARLLVTAGNALHLIPVGQPDKGCVVFRPPAGWSLYEIPSIHPTEAKALVLLQKGAQAGRILELDLISGHEILLAELPFYTGHAHYAPHNPEIIGFCHEGPTETVSDRVWYMPKSSPTKAAAIWDQKVPNEGKPLCLGHEVWLAHEAACAVVAYGVSPVGPRGLYQLSPHHGPLLISGGDRDWHVGSRSDGSLWVCDTTGPHDAPGTGWENAGHTSDILLVDPVSGQRHFFARTRFSPQGHPGHPHPRFSPDGLWVWWNEGTDTAVNACCGAIPPDL